MPKQHRHRFDKSGHLPSITLQTTVDPQALGEMIAEAATEEQALSVIQNIDLAMQDYDFTLKLARWCVSELKRSSPEEEPFSLAELE